MKEKFVVYSWDKLQTAIFVFVIILYVGYVGGGLYFFYFDLLLENALLFELFFVFIVLWIILSYTVYSVNGTFLEISKYLFIKKHEIGLNKIESFETNEHMGGLRGNIVIFGITLLLKNNKTEKLDFFSEVNKDKLAAKLKEIVKQN